MDKIRVNLGENSYPIYIGQGVLHRLGSLLSEKPGGKYAVITNPNVNKLYGKVVKRSLEPGFQPVFLEVPDSETSKSLKYVEKLYDRLLRDGFGRDTCIIALGGGVIGDLAGFVAATYMRGVSYVQVPTTLLAQVDSAIGGKVAVDLPQGKNLIGAFYQPKLVVSDVETLLTLPEDELKSGLAEVVKYGVISDPYLFEFLEKNIEKVWQRDLKTLVEIVKRCSVIKAKVVEEDEKEQGRRMILNLGHTLGHALESVTKYTGYSHGEAVAVGMVFAARLSLRLGMLNTDELNRVVNLIQSLGLPVEIEKHNDVEGLIKTMWFDKKIREGKIRFILPERIGEVVITEKVPMDLLKEELREMFR
jgi:3-dehydroquinate synthase